MFTLRLSKDEDAQPKPPPTRLPREGGDPEQGQLAVSVPQVWAPAFAEDADGGIG